MLLRRIELDRFRGIRHVHVDLDDTTAIIGENGAGKTTLLDALAICLGGRDDSVVFEPRDLYVDEDGRSAGDVRVSLTFDATRGTAARSGVEAGQQADAFAGDAREVTLHVRGAIDRARGGVTATWTFVAGRRRATASSAPGLLAAWRRAHPILRLRANRYVEANPRGGPPPAVVSGADPVASEIEVQIQRIYERLSGASDLTASELRTGLDAAEAYLAEHARSAPAMAQPPRRMGDLAEAPLRSGRNPQALLSSIKQGAGLRGLALVALIGATLEAGRKQGFSLGSRPLLLLEDAEAHLHPLTLSAMWELVATIDTQKLLTTNSGELLASVPLRSIRRMVTTARGTTIHRVDTQQYRLDELRRIAYHVRLNRAGAFFARCWLLVEGETEAWLLPELAQVCGYDFPSEGIRCVEYAQCGVRPLVRLASDLGIAWHLLADGDRAGQSYERAAASLLRGRPHDDHITVLDEADIEHTLFHGGFSSVYQALAGRPPSAATGDRAPAARERASRTIARAVASRSKPGVVFAVLEAANAAGMPAVPAQLRALIETVVGLARGNA